MSAASPVWHPFTQHGLGIPEVEIARAEGAWLTTRKGERILDAISSWWVTTHGHRHPAIMAAIRRQTETLDQVIFADLTHAPAEQLARELVALAPSGLVHVFYSDSGSTAVEVALKMALGYWRNIGEPRRRIVALDHAYHGDTVGAMSAGARGVFTHAYEPLLFDVARIPFPHAGCERATLDAFDALCREAPVAALIVEPLILGAGGMLMYSAEVLADLARIARRHGVLFIADEVMTGWGRTGTLWACEQAGLAPDILCTAKGLTGGSVPLAATLATSAIYDAHLSHDRARMFFHSSSFTANPINCAAALANVGIWRNEPVRERIVALSAAQERSLDRLRNHPNVEAVRRCGTITALDLKSSTSGYLATAAPTLGRCCLERGVLLRPLGTTIYTMPPYCITADELARVHDVIGEAVERAEEFA